MGSTWTWAAFQSVVICFLMCSDSRQHMVLYLSLERQTLDPKTSARAKNTAEHWSSEQPSHTEKLDFYVTGISPKSALKLLLSQHSHFSFSCLS